ncbi:MAG: nuclear transport factor 2 family protein [Alphaproteobacteria bacterium]|nr:MAG: nuclear transport factor 2 family protein [Alphaproteobacteria bacterium]
MRFTIWAIGPIALSIASAASAQNLEVQSLVDRFEASRIQHDPAALTKTLAADYEEISPVGEVDAREKVLGFYAPELKRPAPAMTSEPLVIRSRGDVAVITTRKSFTFPGGAARSVRVRYVAERAAGGGQMAIGFGVVHPNSASEGRLIYLAKLLAPCRLLRTAGFEKPAIIPIHHPNRDGRGA